MSNTTKSDDTAIPSISDVIDDAIWEEPTDSTASNPLLVPKNRPCVATTDKWVNWCRKFQPEVFNVIDLRTHNEWSIAGRCNDVIGVLAGTEIIDDMIISSMYMNLKVISRIGTGVDNIALTDKYRNKVKIDVAETSTAEAVLEWDKRQLVIHGQRGEFYDGFGMFYNNIGTNTRFGIIGNGNIGGRVNKYILDEYKSIPLTYDIDSKKSNSVSAKTVFENSDVVFVHIPLTAENDKIFGKNVLEWVTPNATIIAPIRTQCFDWDGIFKFFDENPETDIKLICDCKIPWNDEQRETYSSLLGCLQTTNHTATRTFNSFPKMVMEAVNNLLYTIKSVSFMG